MLMGFLLLSNPLVADALFSSVRLQRVCGAGGSTARSFSSLDQTKVDDRTIIEPNRQAIGKAAGFLSFEVGRFKGKS